MAKRAGAGKTARTSAKRAGKPTIPGNQRSRAAKSAKAARRAGRPSHADLDIRDRLKAGPRRQAGPPLDGDIPDRAAVKALRDEVVTKPTDPGNRRARR